MFHVLIVRSISKKERVMFFGPNVGVVFWAMLITVVCVLSTFLILYVYEQTKDSWFQIDQFDGLYWEKYNSKRTYTHNQHCPECNTQDVTYSKVLENNEAQIGLLGTLKV